MVGPGANRAIRPNRMPNTPRSATAHQFLASTAHMAASPAPWGAEIPASLSRVMTGVETVVEGGSPAAGLPLVGPGSLLALMLAPVHVRLAAPYSLEAVFRIGERGVLQPGRCTRSAAATG